MVIAVAYDEHAQALAARLKPDEREIAHALRAVQRKFARRQVARETSNLDYHLAFVGGSGALRELTAQGVDEGRAVGRHVSEAARGEPSYRPVGDREACDARGVGAQNAPDGLDDCAERRRALAPRVVCAPEREDVCRARLRLFRRSHIGPRLLEVLSHIASILPELLAKDSQMRNPGFGLRTDERKA